MALLIKSPQKIIEIIRHGNRQTGNIVRKNEHLLSKEKKGLTFIGFTQQYGLGNVRSQINMNANLEITTSHYNRAKDSANAFAFGYRNTLNYNSNQDLHKVFKLEEKIPFVQKYCIFLN